MRIPRFRALALVLFSLALLAGCATSTGHIDPGKMPSISPGMTKQEVIRSLGPPESASADGSTETLYYVEERPWWQWARMQVKFVDGKVVSFGEAGQSNQPRP
jgi:outer membrane protein assembly factor BamE (lipoprotein component of BamABCDE complex)